MARYLLILVAAAALASHASAEDPYAIAWKRQLGTPLADYGYGVAADGMNNIYLTGFTDDDLAGTNLGNYDAYVTKYDSSGNVVWARQFGTSGRDVSTAATTDALGNICLCGYTSGSLAGPSAGIEDAFVCKFDSAGSLLWTRQFGSAAIDGAYGVATDVAGNVFVGGDAGGPLVGPLVGGFDAFVSKYGPSGNLLWTRQLGSSTHDHCRAVATDDLGNVYLGGWTGGSLPGQSHEGGSDAFVAKYDPAGNLLWIRQIGTSGSDLCSGVATDAIGNVFLGGSTWGDLGDPQFGFEDAYVAKFDSTGQLQWISQSEVSTSDGDDGRAVAVDAHGDVYLTGSTEGDLAAPNRGRTDVFLSKLDTHGDLLWSVQLGSGGGDAALACVADAIGNICIAGHCDARFAGTYLGDSDAFLIKLAVPEPATLALVALGAGLALRRRRAR